MKKITRIEDVYTVPKTEAEWILTKTSSEFSAQKGCLFNELDNRVISVSLNLLTNKTEIPVDQFLDLLNDKITPWRLLEVGFNQSEYSEPLFAIVIDEWTISVDTSDETVWLMCFDRGGIVDITTFTELLQQMKFLGWKNERE